jgi:predicted ATP-dependent serine protease
MEKMDSFTVAVLIGAAGVIVGFILMRFCMGFSRLRTALEVKRQSLFVRERSPLGDGTAVAGGYEGPRVEIAEVERVMRAVASSVQRRVRRASSGHSKVTVRFWPSG